VPAQLNLIVDRRSRQRREDDASGCVEPATR
jgi:hypothetical protein